MVSSWIELVVDGPRGWTRGFIEGHVRGAGSDLTVLDAEAEGFDVETLRERLGELIHPSRERVHLLFPAQLGTAVRRAITAAARAGEAEERSERSIAGARFAFSIEAFSRTDAARIRALFEPAPAGVTLSAESKFEESVHPEDAGVELYAPTHEYELRGRGVVEGEVGAIVTLYRNCRAEQLVHVDRAELIEAPAR